MTTHVRTKFSKQPKALMPRGTAIWLIDNTSLSFDQIAEFCDLHPLEVQAIADGEVEPHAAGLDPIKYKQLTREEIARCEADHTAKLHLSDDMIRIIEAEGHKTAKKYVPMAKRQSKPHAILWLLKQCPELSNSQISKLIGTTSKTVSLVREKTHSNYAELIPSDPILFGLCSQVDFDAACAIARLKAEEERIKTSVEAIRDIEGSDNEHYASIEYDSMDSDTESQA